MEFQWKSEKRTICIKIDAVISDMAIQVLLFALGVLITILLR